MNWIVLKFSIFLTSLLILHFQSIAQSDTTAKGTNLSNNSTINTDVIKMVRLGSKPYFHGRVIDTSASIGTKRLQENIFLLYRISSKKGNEFRRYQIPSITEMNDDYFRNHLGNLDYIYYDQQGNKFYRRYTCRSYKYNYTYEPTLYQGLFLMLGEALGSGTYY
jgi:hypothetical protein